VTSARVDAVVVGSGPNGLTAAIALARAGRSVLVLEAQDRLGGAVATEELTLPGFRHDVFSSVYPAAAASPVFAALPLARHGLRWTHPEVAMAHPLEDGRAGALTTDLDVTVATLDELHADDGARWRELAAPYVRHFSAVRATMLSGFPPIAGPARLLLALRLRGTLDFAALALMSAETLAARLFASEGARAWLYGSALHGDVALGSAGSAVSGLYLQLLGHAVGWPSPEGGAGRLAAALVGVLREAGGQMRTGARVARVLVERGRAAGVETAGGDVVRAPVVVCDTTPHGLLALASDALPADYVRRLVAFRYGPATVKLDWALDGSVPWRSAAARRAGTVHVGGPASDVASAVSAATTEGRLPERPFLLFGQQSVADPTRAPAGKHTAWAYTHVPRGVDWLREREPFAARIEEQVERFAPGFRDLVLARHVMAPGDLQARDANLEGGDVGGGSYALDQLIFRPVPSLSPYRTPLRGLYIGSASTFPGGAVHGVPGHAAARAALMDLRLRRV
jgi:phytoene dehydrogenase-like protein